MKWNDLEYREKTEKIIKAFYKVHDTLGPGFLEEAYHNALIIELKKHFTNIESEKEFLVLYESKRSANIYRIY